jgi:tRNA A-37 threonylcarbamoyl transferase component Bud32
MAVDNANTGERESLLDQVLGSYLEALDTGKAPHRDELLARHPELAGELAVFFADQDRISSLTAGLRQTLQPADAEATVDAADAATRDHTVAAGLALGTFGDYDLLEEIGRGGMSVVYKARQRSLNRLVAVKMIRADRLATEDDIRRFHHEAETVAKLEHPATVPIYEVGRWDAEGLDAPIVYFSMKLIEGGNLTALCRTATAAVDERRAVEILATAARALHHAHEQGILHRDLKPSNILLDLEGRPHVSDFGLALHLGRDQSLTQTGAVIGTPSYMPPEQAAGQKDLTPAADVYGLGAVLYSLLTGRPPFKGATTLDTLLDVREREADPPSLWNAALDRTLEAICLKCLAKEPQKRYASAAALADDLEHWLAGEPTLARPERWRGRLRREWRRHRGKVALAMVALVMVAIVVYANTVGRGPSPEEVEARRQQQALASLQRDLTAGKPVELIRETGPPGYFRWETAVAGQQTFLRDDGVFAVHGPNEGLLELVPDPLHDCFRFQAEIRQEASGGTLGHVGLYIAHAGFVAKDGPGHSFCKLFYNDLAIEQNMRQGNALRLTRQVLFEPFLAGPSRDMTDHWYFNPAGPNPQFGPMWRQLAIELKRGAISVLWDGQQVLHLPRDKVLQSGYLIPDERYDVRSLELVPRGGLGLYIHKSTASFRSVHLQPIPDQEQ